MKPSTNLLAPPKLEHPFEWIWTAWLLSVIVSFGVLEGEAIHRKRSTLSHFIVELSKAWAPFPWVVGGIMGGLIVHFSGWGAK